MRSTRTHPARKRRRLRQVATVLQIILLLVLRHGYALHAGLLALALLLLPTVGNGGKNALRLRGRRYLR